MTPEQKQYKADYETEKAKGASLKAKLEALQAEREEAALAAAIQAPPTAAVPKPVQKDLATLQTEYFDRWQRSGSIPKAGDLPSGAGIKPDSAEAKALADAFISKYNL